MIVSDRRDSWMIVDNNQQWFQIVQGVNHTLLTNWGLMGDSNEQLVIKGGLKKIVDVEVIKKGSSAGAWIPWIDSFEWQGEIQISAIFAGHLLVLNPGLLKPSETNINIAEAIQ